MVQILFSKVSPGWMLSPAELMRLRVTLYERQRIGHLGAMLWRRMVIKAQESISDAVRVPSIQRFIEDYVLSERASVLLIWYRLACHTLLRIPPPRKRTLLDRIAILSSSIINFVNTFYIIEGRISNRSEVHLCPCSYAIRKSRTDCGCVSLRFS
ncbi:hypothetical protein CPB84DRAFT_1780493 [Gymnopilus junonius]|uniref:Uncharacterized protein n=1 Tax=Gymnopilus junonius TaxID=109634 RepID=A0A9P5NNL8_GYMJU|nr:hypothetical protein CPB84DRAFT_1780493 [Gymnopilus junonius]